MGDTSFDPGPLADVRVEASGDLWTLVFVRELRHTLQDCTWAPKAAAGWNLCLVVAEHLLDGDPIEPIVGSKAKNFGWEALDRDYGAELGIASSGWPT